MMPPKNRRAIDALKHKHADWFGDDADWFKRNPLRVFRRRLARSDEYEDLEATRIPGKTPWVLVFRPERRLFFYRGFWGPDWIPDTDLDLIRLWRAWPGPPPGYE